MGAMQTRRAEASTPGPRLPVALKEITERLLQDDWYRVSTEDRARKYYIVGCADQAADLDGEGAFSRLEFPIPTKAGPLSEWHVRSQLADNKPGHFLKGARQNIERAGAQPAAIDRFLAGETDDLSELKFDREVSADERLKLLSTYLQAARLNFPDAQSVKLDSDEEEEASIEREKVCLKELADRYSKIVDRWEQLERLRFNDPQLEEASRTFLYGFYRASVVLCASAVETQLRHIVPSAPGVSADAGPSYLIHSAQEAKLISLYLAEIAKDLFRFRNRVVHDNQEPSHDEAKKWLGSARMLVKTLRVA
jgi:hypothetical protein